jgi:hypothetical protein
MRTRINELADVLIRKQAAQSPQVYGDLVADRPWRINGIVTASDGSRHIIYCIVG